MDHSFDIDVAKEYGIEEAIFLRNMQWWITKNRANNSNRKAVIVDGVKQYRTWTFNTAEALSKLFPYLSVSQLYRIVSGLKKKNVIFVEKFNTNPYDKTNWYAFVDEEKFLINRYSPDEEETQEEVQEKETQEETKKIYRMGNRKKSFVKNKYTHEFTEAHLAYGRGSKVDAWNVWLKMSQEDRDAAIEGIEAFKKANPEAKYRPHFCRYLKSRRWEDFDIAEEKEFVDYEEIGGTNNDAEDFDFDDNS